MKLFFKPGDVALIRSINTKHNGKEVTVLDTCKWMKFTDINTHKNVRGFFYKIRLPDGSTGFTRWWRLTKPKGPTVGDRNTIVSWKDCDWQPLREKA